MLSIPPLDRKGLRQFGLLFAGFTGGIFGLVLPWLVHASFPLWPWIVAAAVALWALVAPATLNVLYRVWMTIGLAINAVVTRVILGVVYYLLVVPMGLFMRMRGHDPMARVLGAKDKTYRKVVEANRHTDMEKPF